MQKQSHLNQYNLVLFWPISGATILGQSGSESDNNEEPLSVPQIYSIT